MGASEFIKNLDEKSMETDNFLNISINYDRGFDFQKPISKKIRENFAAS